MRAIWVRARVCLGGATLKAVFDRVLEDNMARWPHLSFVEATCSGVVFHRDDPALGSISEDQLRESGERLVSELVEVLASLSGRVLAGPLRLAVHRVHARTAWS